MRDTRTDTTFIPWLLAHFGILLALPASAALLVGLRHAKQSYLASNTYLK